MDRNFAKALKLVLHYEGGYVNNAADPGGPTNKGITLANYRRFVKSNGTIADLKAITDQEVAKVYRKQYWDVVKGDDLPDGIDFATFDYGVNSGPQRAIKHLQSVVGATPDGKIGPATLSAIKAIVPQKVIADYCAMRLSFLRGLKTWGTFGKGWEARVNSVRAEALLMQPNDGFKLYSGHDTLEHAPDAVVVTPNNDAGQTATVMVATTVDTAAPTTPIKPSNASGIATILAMLAGLVASYFGWGHK